MKNQETNQECNHEIVVKFGIAECQNCGMEESEIISLKKKETLEKFIQRQLSLGKYQDQESAIYHSIELTASWMQKRMYSEEEVIYIFKKWEEFNIIQDSFDSQDDLTFIEWFKQFKNK